VTRLRFLRRVAELRFRVSTVNVYF